MRSKRSFATVPTWLEAASTADDRARGYRERCASIRRCVSAAAAKSSLLLPRLSVLRGRDQQDDKRDEERAGRQQCDEQRGRWPCGRGEQRDELVHVNPDAARLQKVPSAGLRAGDCATL